MDKLTPNRDPVGYRGRGVGGVGHRGNQKARSLTTESVDGSDRLKDREVRSETTVIESPVM